MSPSIFSLPPLTNSPSSPSSTAPPATTTTTGPSPPANDKSTGGSLLTLREEIIKGLKGSEVDIVPGGEEEDKKWKYRRSLPTMVLYDEKGLRLYDKITEDAPEYYLFQAELNLLRTKSHEIATFMGFPTPNTPSKANSENSTPDTPPEQQEQDHTQNEQGPKNKDKEKEKWGDEKVGKWNGGVNGEEGLGDTPKGDLQSVSFDSKEPTISGGKNAPGSKLKAQAERADKLVEAAVEQTGEKNHGVNGNTKDEAGGENITGWDIVELGAGSLRKTSHFLKAIATTVQPSPFSDSSAPAPITYHALDLSLPELERTLKQLEEANAEEFRGRIECRGLWGDYERGIGWIREGGLERGFEKGGVREEEEGEKKPMEAAVLTVPENKAQPAVPSTNSIPSTPQSTSTSTKTHSTSASQTKPTRPSASPLMLPRKPNHSYSSSNNANAAALRRRGSASSLNSFTLDEGPLVELAEEPEEDEGYFSVEDGAGSNGDASEGGRRRGTTRSGNGSDGIGQPQRRSSSLSRGWKGLRGVRHSEVDLDAGEWKRSGFKGRLLQLLRELKLPLWSEVTIKPNNVHLSKVSGALTNAVFFCSYNPSATPTEPTMSPMLTPKIPGMSSGDYLTHEQHPPTLLIRVYGPSTGSLIARDEELRILHTLSSVYGLGPRIEGTFANGRVEQFFPSRALSPPEIHQPETSRLIARRMRELHSVDLDVLGFEAREEPTVWTRIKEWLPSAKKAVEGLRGRGKWGEWMEEYDLEGFEEEVGEYMRWVDAHEGKGAERIFSHNDAQYGNILQLEKTLPAGAPKHHQLIVIDFEYAAPNYRGYDIANHFHEWQSDYNHVTHAHSLSHHAPYPTKEERENFFRAYLSVQMDGRNGHERIGDESKVDPIRVERLEEEVRIWSPAPSAFWSLWGLIQAEEQVDAIVAGEEKDADFCNLAFAFERVQMFRREAQHLGAIKPRQRKPKVNGQANGNSASKQESPHRPLHILFLGSSLGNFDRQSAGPFLKSLPLRPGSSDTLLLGLDGRPSASETEALTNGRAPGQLRYEDGKRKIEVAYDDPKGRTRDFIMHGVDVAAEALDTEEATDTVEEIGSPRARRTSLRRDSWSYKSRYNVPMGRHEAYLASNEDQEVTWNVDKNRRDSIEVSKGELLNIEWSLKYSMTETLALFEEAQLVPVTYWQDSQSNYRLWLLRKPPFYFPLSTITLKNDPQSASPSIDTKQSRFSSIPTREEWTMLWKYWDTVTLGMIPEKMLHQKPIDLRHKCLFYLGHIPTFLDIHLTRLLKGKHTEPERYKDIFERGIDPHVDDPNQCHSHSIVPEKDDEWPALPEILGFRDRVRQRLFSLYDEVDSGKRAASRRLGRVVWMCYEHEAYHAETLLYMLLQSRSTLPPSGFPQPNWSLLSSPTPTPTSPPLKSLILSIPPGIIHLGHADHDTQDDQYVTIDNWEGHEFGWDNESPGVELSVEGFRVESLPVRCGEYWEYMQVNGIKTIPGSWSSAKDPGSTPEVKTLYGPVPLSLAKDWPLMASLEEISGFAKWKGGRLPTEGELRRLWESEGGPRPAGLGGNVGLRRWHPIAPTNTQIDSCGKILHGHNGGVWEWTSTLLEGHPGWEESQLYPGYSSDFFDGLHYVVLGGSFATLPRLASRSSLRNFYQAKYPYAWVGGRVVYDA